MNNRYRLIVGEDSVSVTDEERAGIEAIGGLLASLQRRAREAGRIAQLVIELPDGNHNGNDVVVMSSVDGDCCAWTQGDPTRGYGHRRKAAS